MVVIITDGDDCSLIERAALAGLSSEEAVDLRCASLGEPALASVGDSIDWLRPDDPRLLIVGLVGLVGGAAPRLAELEAALPERFTSTDVAGPHWADALTMLAGWGTVVGNPCFDRAIDLEPSVPGYQPECVGSLGTRDGWTPLPWCHDPGAAPPCMRVYEDPLACPDLVAVNVDVGDERIIGGAWAEIRCAMSCD
jgi:hypothetical protein